MQGIAGLKVTLNSPGVLLILAAVLAAKAPVTDSFKSVIPLKA